MIAGSAAIANAETAAKAWYAANKAKLDADTTVGTLNTGPTDTFISNAQAEAVIAAWKNKGDWNGLGRRASLTSASSADQSIDLKLAQPGRSASCFNYHVLIGQDPAAAAKAKAIALEAARMKQLAVDNKKRLDDLAVKKKEADDAAAKVAAAAKLTEAKRLQAMATDYKVAAGKDANLKKADKKTAWEKAWLEKNKNRKF